MNPIFVLPTYARSSCLPVALGFALLAALCDASRAQPTSHAQEAPHSARTVAITLDDVPATRNRTLAEMQQITTGLLTHLNAFDISAIGFVNEAKLGDPVEPERIALLEQWLDAGQALGNHTYSHPKFYDTPLETYQADVLRGEIVTKQLLAERGQQLRYFRHPYLSTGPDLATKTAFEQFLASHGYMVAPVTIDNDEYIYALAYENAVADQEEDLAARLGDDYVRYMAEMFSYFEHYATAMLGREPPQVLLLHANTLNADYLGDLAQMIQGRGYQFVSLEVALRDPVYTLTDGYIGERGPSWLQRWAITQGNEPMDVDAEPPQVPRWVRTAAFNR